MLSPRGYFYAEKQHSNKSFAIWRYRGSGNYASRTVCNTVCEFVTGLGWANNEIKNAAGKFLDLAAFENINSCIAIKLWNKYILRIKLL